jgi:hypothetical protein
MSDKRRKAKRLAKALQQLHPLTRALARMGMIMRPTINRLAHELLQANSKIRGTYIEQVNSFMKEYEAWNE